jgi:mono/diheme cytochrome c family protein
MKKIINQINKMKLVGFLLVGSTLFCLSFISVNQVQDGAWVAPKEADSIKNPLKDNALAITKGKALYNQMCVVCHGAKGKGDGAAGANLKPKPTDFTSAASQSQSDGALYWKLTEGKKLMASYKKILKDEQRWQVVDYMRDLEKTAAGK